VRALVSKALGAEEDQEGLLEATAPDELLKAELIGVLVSQAYKAWNATPGSSGATGDTFGAGTTGEVCAFALLLGLAYMLWKKVISWHIPVSIRPPLKMTARGLA
jgi:Na+-translocating ferredoxin:NAD+ oxidoreductase RnfD subunit